MAYRPFVNNNSNPNNIKHHIFRVKKYFDTILLLNNTGWFKSSYSTTVLVYLWMQHGVLRGDMSQYSSGEHINNMLAGTEVLLLE